jgi:hypothetical protein
LAVAAIKTLKRKYSDFWLCIALEPLNNQDLLLIQWFEKTEKENTYELTNLTDTIHRDSIICSGIEMKYVWGYKEKLANKIVGIWKLRTTEAMITNLHQEKYVSVNPFQGLPLIPAAHKAVLQPQDYVPHQ